MKNNVFKHLMLAFSPFFLLAIAMALVMLSGIARAEGETPNLANLDQWRLAWTDVVAFGTMVFGVVAFARANIKLVESWQGLAVTAFSVGVGGVLGLMGVYLFGMPPAPFSSLGIPLGGIVFGLAAGLGASIGYDGIKSILGLLNGTAKPVGTTRDDAARGRL